MRNNKKKNTMDKMQKINFVMIWPKRGNLVHGLLLCKIVKSQIDLKLKARSEFPNVWGEYKNHSNPYIHGTTLPCDGNTTYNSTPGFLFCCVGLSYRMLRSSLFSIGAGGALPSYCLVSSRAL